MEWDTYEILKKGLAAGLYSMFRKRLQLDEEY